MDKIAIKSQIYLMFLDEEYDGATTVNIIKALHDLLAQSAKYKNSTIGTDAAEDVVAVKICLALLSQDKAPSELTPSEIHQLVDQTLEVKQVDMNTASQPIEARRVKNRLTEATPVVLEAKPLNPAEPIVQAR